MGCTSSKMVLQDQMAPVAKEASSPYRFWPLRPKISEVSLKKRDGDNAMLIMDRHSSVSDHHRPHNEDQQQIVSDARRVSASDNCGKKEQALQDAKEQQNKNVEKLTRFSSSLSFKVYVIKLNSNDKIDDDDKSPKLDNIMENEESSHRHSIKEDNFQQLQHEESLTSSSKSMRVETKKTTIGEMFRRVLPKRNMISFLNILRTSGLYGNNNNNNKFKSLSKSDAKLS